MSLSVSIKVDDANVTARLNKLKQDVILFVKSEPKKIGDDMVNAMQQEAPVDTGFMRDHISITNQSESAVQVSSTADYSIYVEMGTKFQRAQPFFFKVFDRYSAADMQADFTANVSTT